MADAPRNIANTKFTAIGMIGQTFADILGNFYDADNFRMRTIVADNGDYGLIIKLIDEDDKDSASYIDEFFTDMKGLETTSPSGTLVISPMQKLIKTQDLSDFMDILDKMSEAFDLNLDLRPAKVVDMNRVDTDPSVIAERLRDYKPLLKGVNLPTYVSLSHLYRDVAAYDVMEHDEDNHLPRPHYDFTELRSAIHAEKVRKGLEPKNQTPLFYFH